MTSRGMQKLRDGWKMRLAAATFVVSALFVNVTAIGTAWAGPKEDRLFQSVRDNDISAVRQSLTAGADIFATDFMGNRAVDVAVDLGLYDIAHYLVSAMDSERARQASQDVVAVEPAPTVQLTPVVEPSPAPQPTPPEFTPPQPVPAEAAAIPVVPPHENPFHVTTDQVTANIAPAPTEMPEPPQDAAAHAPAETSTSTQTLDDILNTAQVPSQHDTTSSTQPYSQPVAQTRASSEHDASPDFSQNTTSGWLGRVKNFLGLDADGDAPTVTERAPQDTPTPVARENTNSGEPAQMDASQGIPAQTPTSESESLQSAEGAYPQNAPIPSENATMPSQEVLAQLASRTPTVLDPPSGASSALKPPVQATTTQQPPPQHLSQRVPVTVPATGFVLHPDLALGKALPEQETGRPCLKKGSRGYVCVENADWPSDLRPFLNDMYSTLYRGTKVVVGYRGDTAYAVYAVFKTEHFKDIVAALERRFGPSVASQRGVRALGADLQANLVRTWSATDQTGRHMILEVMKYDDQRSTFPVMQEGALSLRYATEDTVFRFVETIELQRFN